MEVDPYLPVAAAVTLGAVRPMPGSSIHWFRVSSFTGAPLSSETVTVSRLFPRLAMVSVTVPVAPETRLTRITRAITPMIMPSMVRKARNLLPEMDFIAILNAWIMGPPPLTVRP